ncbi:MAG TPA: hypothetical protein VF278_11045 [Pirellulales bacterium]
MKQCLHIGGLVAVGFDDSGDYLLTISHSGRGVFSTQTWQRVARSTELAYPDEQGIGIGIGPIEGQAIPITEMDYEAERFSLLSPDGRFRLDCESDHITISTNDMTDKH